MSHMLDCQVSKEGVNESSYEIRYDADTNNLVFYDSTLGSLNPIAEICLNTDAKVKFAGEEFKPVVDGLFLRSIPEKWYDPSSPHPEFSHLTDYLRCQEVPPRGRSVFLGEGGRGFRHSE